MCWSGGVSLRAPLARDLLLLPPLLLFLIVSVLPTVTHADRQSTYRTAYACEGMELNIECEMGHVINVIRANYGRFSITICNTQGNTEWSVNCQSVRTQGVLANRCSGKSSCNMAVSSENFEDPCPGTYKYIEVHYACGPATATTTTARPRPPWLHTTRKPMWLPPALVTNFTTTAKPTTTTTTSSTTSTTTTTTPIPTTTFPPATSPVLLLEDNQNDVGKTQDEASPTIINSVAATIAVTASSSSTVVSPIALNITTSRNKLPPPMAPPPIGVREIGYDSPWCPPSFVRGLTWNWTRGGDIAVQPCPGGASGWARRACLIKGWEDHSDLSECRSVWLNTMESRVEAKDSLLNIANDLAKFTGSRVLYGGDLTTAARLLSTLATHMVDNVLDFPDSRQREALVTEMLQAVLTTSSYLLAGGMKGPWGDLSVKERQHAVTQLMVALEEAAFLLADAIPPDTEVVHFKSHVLASVHSAVGNGNYVNFPSEKEQSIEWSFADSISLPPEAILENSNQGVTSVVFLTYRHLEDLLAPENEVLGSSSSGWNKPQFVNSRVVSASLGHGRHIQLPEPVTLTFALLRQENVSKPICAFWDYTTAAWSGEGCLVLNSNYTHVSCQCDHLTNFAVLMEENTGESMEESQTALRILGYVGCAVALLFLVGSLLVFSVFRSLHSPRTAVHRHVCICLSLTELVFVLGVWKTSNIVVCGIVAGVFHYTLLSAFSWMFVEGVHIYLSVVRTVEGDSLRLNWWHYLLTYGLPLLVVFTVAIVDPFSYGTAGYCLPRMDNYFIFSLVGPALLLLLIHLALLAAALIYLCRFVPDDSLKTKEMARLDSSRSWLHGAFTVLFLMVLSWTLGLVFLHQPSLPIAASFCVVNALHGFSIFIYYCLRNQKVFSGSGCGVNGENHNDGAWLPQMMRGMFIQDKQTYSTNTNTSSNNTLNPAITHALTHALSNNHQPTVPNFNQFLPNLCQLNGMKSSEMRMGGSVGGGQVGDSISMNGGAQIRGHLPFDALHQSLPRHHMLSMPHTSTTTITTTTSPSIHHAIRNSNIDGAPNKLWQVSDHGDLEEEESPVWNNAHVNHYSNSSNSDLKNVQLDTLDNINGSGSIGGNPYPHIEGNKLITVPNSYTTQLSPAEVPPAIVAMIRGNTDTVRSYSPWNHTYMEIGTESSDPVYEDIERERYLNHGGQIIQSVGSFSGGEAMQVSDLSGEDVKRGTPSDMSRQSSHSYGDARPLLPYLSQQMIHPRSLEEQFELSEERLRDFNAAQINMDLEQFQHVQRQYSNDNLMTVALLNGEQVVCRLTSPSTPHQSQNLPVIQETCRGGVMVSQPLTNGYPAQLVISHPQHVMCQQFSEC